MFEIIKPLFELLSNYIQFFIFTLILNGMISASSWR